MSQGEIDRLGQAGCVHLQQGRFQEALSHFNRILELDPNHAKAYQLRGAVYHQLKQYERELEDLNKSYQLDGNEVALFNRAICFIGLGRLVEAISDLETFMRVGTHPGTLQQAAQLLQTLKQDTPEVLLESARFHQRRRESIAAAGVGEDAGIPIGGVICGRGYHSLRLSVLGEWVILDCFDADTHEPLRPQTFALTREEWSQVSSGREGTVLELKSPRALSFQKLSGVLVLETADQYGSHFRIVWDDSEARIRQVDEVLAGATPRPLSERLREALDRRWPRFHPIMVALQATCQPDPEMEKVLQSALQSEDSNVVLFACALLHKRLAPARLEEALMRVISQEPPGSNREAAEGQLSQLPISDATAQRLIALLPHVATDLRAFGSLLRPLRQSPASVGPVARLVPEIYERAKASRRLENESVVGLALDLLAAHPERWKESRPAIEWLCRQGHREATAVRDKLAPLVPGGWENGLELPAASPIRSAMAQAKATMRAAPAAVGPAPRVTVAPSSGPGLSCSAGTLVIGFLGAFLLMIVWLVVFDKPQGDIWAERPGPRAAPSSPAAAPRRPAAPVNALPAAGTLSVAGFEPKQEYFYNSFAQRGYTELETAEWWTRYKGPDGRPLTVFWAGASGLATGFQSESLMCDGKPVLTAGKATELTDDDLARLKDARISVQRDRQGTIVAFTWTGRQQTGLPAPFLDQPLGVGPILEAMRKHKLESIIKTLNQSQTNAILSDGTPLIHLEMNTSWTENLKLLLAMGTDPNALDWQGRAALHKAHFPESAQVLLDEGADVDIEDADGQTPLFHAANRFELLEILLARGADPNHRDARGRTALYECGKLDCMKLLLSAGLDPTSRDDRGQTAMESLSPKKREMLKEAIAAKKR